MTRLLYACLIAISFIIFKYNAPKSGEIENYGMENEHWKNRMLDEMMLSDPATGLIPSSFRAKELAYRRLFFGANDKQTRSAVWNGVGPYNVGGRTRAAVLDITNENIIIAASVSNGIWRSTDGGTNWVRVNNPNESIGAISITQDKRAGKQNIWYALTGELSGNSASGGGAYYLGDGVLKSIDSGKSWQPLPSTAGNTPATFASALQAGWRIATHPSTSADYIFAATYGTIFKSADGGATWQISLGSASNSSYYTDIAIATDGTMYATMSSDDVIKGYYRSTDIGVTWTNITPTALISKYERTVLGINPNNENEVYFFALLEDSTNVAGTKTSNYQGSSEWLALLKYNYLSGDGSGSGGQWTDLSNNLPDNNNVTTGPFDKLNVQGGYNMMVTVQPQTNALIIGGTNLYISDDAFATNNNWRQIGGYKIATVLPQFEVFPNHHPDNHDLVFFPSNHQKVLSINDGGLQICNNVNSTALTQWISASNGYITTQGYAITLSPTAGNKWIHGGLQDNGNYVSNDFTQLQKPWTMPFNGDGAHAYIAPNADYFVMTIQEGKMGKFILDANGNVVSRGRIDPAGATRDDYLFINPFAVDPNNSNIMYVPAGKKIYRQSQLNSLPTSNQWDSITTGYFKFSDTIKTINTASGFPAQITCIAVSQKPANVVYIGTSRRDIYRIDSANTGDPKMTLISKNPLPSAYVSDIAIDPDDANKILVCYSNYNIRSMYYSADAGNTWMYCGGNLDKTVNFTATGPSIRSVAIMRRPDGGKKYFVGTSIGLFSADTLLPVTTAVITADSTKWVQEAPTGIGSAVVNDIYVRQSDYMVAVSTHGNGYYTSQYFPAAALQINENVTTNYALSIFPNPVQGNINMQLSLPEDATVQTTLYNMLGTKIRQSNALLLKAGIQKIEINTEGVAPGVYFLLYTDDKKRISKHKVVVLR